MILPEALEGEEVADLLLRTVFQPDDLIELRGIRGRKDITQRWCKAPYMPALLAAQELNATGYNIYVGANPRSRHAGTDKDVALARTLCADFDDAGLTLDYARRTVRDGGYPEPTIWVHSGRGLQCWWLLDEPIRGLGGWRQRQAEIVRRLGTDPTIINPSRVMRVPGFHNMKWAHHPMAVLLVLQ